MSPPERALWHILRAHRLEDIKFSRQVEAGPYYIDFAARRDRTKYDETRTKWQEKQGWRVVRFTNGDVMSNPDGVAIAILSALGKNV